MFRARWKVLVRSYPTGPVLVEVPFTEIMFSNELNGDGAGSVSFDLNSLFLEYGNSYNEVIEQANVWEMYQDDVCVAQFQAESSTVEAISSSLTKKVTISGKGMAASLRAGMILPPEVDGYTAPDYPYNSGRFWSLGPLSGRPANMMAHWADMQDIVKARFAKDVGAIRSPLTYLARSFTPFADSNGFSWPTDDAHTYGGPSDLDSAQANGVTLRDLLDTCSAAAGGTKADWAVIPVWNGSGWIPTLGCAMFYGRDLSEKVAFFNDLVFSQTREVLRDDIRNFPVVRKDTAEAGSGMTVPGGYQGVESRKRYGRRETYYAVAGETPQQPLVDRDLQLYGEELSSWTISVPAEVEVGGTKIYRPFLDYNVGDWIGIPTVGNAGLPDDITKIRVTALSGTVGADGYLTVELTLGTNIQLLRENAALKENAGSV